jgi:AcrR family transcriptional regulator
MDFMSSTDERIAGLAAQLFYTHGISATGVDALSKAAGISKRTLYEQFGSKDGLIAAAYEAFSQPVFDRILGAAERRASTPRGQLEAVFAVIADEARAPDFHGCPFMNATAELNDPDHPAHEVIRRYVNRFRRWMRDRAREAGATNPDLLARQLMIVVDGAQAQSVMEHSSRPAQDARSIAHALIAAAIPAAPTPTKPTATKPTPRKRATS